MNTLLCRLCGEPIYTRKPRNLFKYENRTIKHNIEVITGIELSNNNQMSSHICSCCYLDLEHSIAFRNRCLETNKELSKEFETLNFVIPKLEDDSDDYVEEITSLPENKDNKEFHTTNRSPENWEPKVDKSKRKRQGKPFTNLKKNYICDICGWSFRDLSNMRSHALRHTGEKKYKCPECDKRFFEKPRLKLHIRVSHYGEKPFVCKYCGLRFNNSPNLCRHLRNSHADELPFECDICGKTFITQISLNSHELTHLSEDKNYSCELCNKTFTVVGSYRKHITTKVHQRKMNQR